MSLQRLVRGLVWTVLAFLVMGWAVAQQMATLETPGFVQTLDGQWTGRKVINTRYPGSVSLVRGDAKGGVAVAGQLYSSGQGGNGPLPFVVRYAANGVLQWSKALLVDDLALDAAGNLYLSSTSTDSAAIDQSCPGLPRSYTLSKLSPEGHELWSLELCADSDYGKAFLEVTPQGRLLVSASGVLAPYCLGVAQEASLLSLDPDGLMEWCAPLAAASRPKVDALGHSYVLEGEAVKGFSPGGQALWRASADAYFSPRSIEGFDASGNLILSDLDERVLLLDARTGQLTRNFSPQYLECSGRRITTSGDRLYSASVLQGQDGTPYYYLSECNLLGQVLNIRRWLETDLRIVDTFDNGLPGVLIGGSTSLPNQSEQFPFVQRLSPSLGDQ